MFWRRRRHLEERIELLRLDLARVEGASNLTNLLLATLNQTGHRIMSQLDEIISALNDNTNAVAARLDHLIAQLQSASQAPTPGQLAELQSISDHLKAMGQDPAAPLPTSTPTAAVQVSAPTIVPAPAPSAPSESVTAEHTPVDPTSTPTA